MVTGALLFDVSATKQAKTSKNSALVVISNKFMLKNVVRKTEQFGQNLIVCPKRNIPYTVN